MSGKLLWFAMLMFLSSVFAGERLPVDDTLWYNYRKAVATIVLIKKEGIQYEISWH